MASSSKVPLVPHPRDLAQRKYTSSGPSSTSRLNSASEASRTIETRPKGVVAIPRWTGKEGQSEISRNVRVQPTLSRLVEGEKSTRPTQQISTSRNDTIPFQHPFTRKLIPNPNPDPTSRTHQTSSFKKPARITLKPQPNISRLGPPPIELGDPHPPPISGLPQDADNSAKAISTKLSSSVAGSSKQFAPKQKIKPLYSDPTAKKSTSKIKGPIVPARPLSPTLRLREPEEGVWEDGGHGWKRQEVPSVSGKGAAGEGTEGRGQAEDDIIVNALSKPVRESPGAERESIPSPPRTTTLRVAVPTPSSRRAEQTSQSSKSRNMSAVSPVASSPVHQPGRSLPVQVPLFDAPPDESEDDLLPLPNHRPQDRQSQSESPVPDPIPRSLTQRQGRLMSPDSDHQEDVDRGHSRVHRTSPTRVDSSSFTHRGRSSPLPPSPFHASQFHEYGPDHPRTSGRAEPKRQADTISGRSRSAHSAPKTPQTYGAKSKSMIPPPPTRRSEKDIRRLDGERRDRREKRRGDIDELQMLGSGARVGGHQRFGYQAPISDVRDSSYPRSRRRHSTSSHRPSAITRYIDDEAGDVQYDEGAIIRGGIDIVPEEREGTQDGMEVDGNAGPSRLFTAGAGADVLVPDSDEEEGEDMEKDPAPIWSRTQPQPWDMSRSRARQSDRARRTQSKYRNASPTYRYAPDGRPLSPIAPEYYRQPSNEEDRQSRKRRATEADEVDLDEEEEERRRRKRRRRSKPKLFLDPSAFEDEVVQPHDIPVVDPRLVPMSKHRDPVLKDYERHMKDNGLFVAKGKTIDRTGQVWAHNNISRKERHGNLLPRLRMSRRKSAGQRTEKYVSIISEHSKSSRAHRYRVGRCPIARAEDIPEYLVKPIKTIKWAEYNAAYNEERAFPIDEKLIKRTIADRRAMALRQAQGRNRLRNTQTGVKRDREIRRQNARLRDNQEPTERIDTVTPSQHPFTPIATGNRPLPRHAPRLNFTTRSPTPPPIAKSQKRKISNMLQSAERGDAEIVGAEGVDGDGIWEDGAERPDPIVADFFDEAEPQVVPEVVRSTRGGAGRTSRGTATGIAALPIKRQLSNSTEAEDDLGQFLQDQLGSTELQEIEKRVPIVNPALPRILLRSKPSRPPIDEITDDYPSIPTASVLRSRPSNSERRDRDRESTVGPTSEGTSAATTTTGTTNTRTTTTGTTSTSKMMSGQAITKLLMEQMLQGLANVPSVGPPPTGGLKGQVQTRLRQKKLDEIGIVRLDAEGREIGIGRASTRDKGKGRDPGERPYQGRRATGEDLAIPETRRTYQPRATQLPAEMELDAASDNEGSERELPQASAKVIVRGPSAAPTLGSIGSAPRLGLQRTRTSGQAGLSIKTPWLSGKSMSILKSQFRTPTQVAPTQSSPSRPALRETTHQHYPSSDIDHVQDNGDDDEMDDDGNPTPYMPAGQQMLSPTQATTTTSTSRTQLNHRRRSFATPAKASTTEKDSSPSDSRGMSTSSGPDQSSSSIHSRRSIARLAPTLLPNREYTDHVQTPTRALYAPRSGHSGKHLPVNPRAMLGGAGKSLGGGVPMHSALKRSTGTGHLALGETAGSGPSRYGGQGGVGQKGVKGMKGTKGISGHGGQQRGEREEGGGGVNMARIGSQRSRQQFRAPSSVQQGRP